MLSDWRRVRNSSRNLFFGTMVSVCFFCCRHFWRFNYDLTVSRAWHRHQLMRIWIRNTVVPSDWRGIENLSRNLFFWDDGKCFCCFYCRHFLHFVCDLTVFQAWIRHQSTRISFRNAVMLSDWRGIKNSSRNHFFCDNGKCFVVVLPSSLFTIRLWSHRFSSMA